MAASKEVSEVEQLLALKVANQGQVEDLLVAMEMYDREGLGVTEVTLPPTIAQQVESFFPPQDEIRATLSLEPGYVPESITPDIHSLVLQKAVFTVDLPHDVISYETDGRHRRPVAIISYQPRYPIPGKEDIYDGLYLDKFDVYRELYQGGGYITQPLQDVVRERTGSLDAPSPVTNRRWPIFSSRPEQRNESNLILRMRQRGAVIPLEAQQVLNTIHSATARGRIVR